MASTSLADRAARGAQALRPGTGKVTTVKDMVRDIIGDLGAIAPRGVDPNRILELAYTAMREDPKLMDCTAASLVGGLVMSLRLGLEIGGPLGQSYLVPFKNGATGQTEATWMLGYRGMIHLAYRSGQIEHMAVVPVWPEDRYEVELGSDWRIVHIPDLRAPHDASRAKPIAYYMRVKLKGSSEAFVLPPLTAVDIEHHRRFSKGKNSPAWVDHYVAMASKTVVREDARYLPLSVEVAGAIAADDSIVRAQDDGLTIDTTASPATTADEPTAPPRDQARAASAPSVPAAAAKDAAPAPEPRKRVAAPQEPAASAQETPQEPPPDPHTAVRMQLGRLGLRGADVRRLLAPFEALDVISLRPEQAAALANALAAIEAGEGATERAVEAVRALEEAGA